MHILDGVTKGQQNQILTSSTLAFTVCFAVWTIFSIIGLQIKIDLGLNDTQFGLLVAIPILTGSLSRIFLGIWADQYGGRMVYTLLMRLAEALRVFTSFIVSICNKKPAFHVKLLKEFYSPVIDFK